MENQSNTIDIHREAGFQFLSAALCDRCGAEVAVYRITVPAEAIARGGAAVYTRASERYLRAVMEAKNRFIESIRKERRSGKPAERAKAGEKKKSVWNEVVEIVSSEPGISTNVLCKKIHANKGYILDVLSEMVESGALESYPGTRNATLWRVPAASLE